MAYLWLKRQEQASKHNSRFCQQCFYRSLFQFMKVYYTIIAGRKVIDRATSA